MDCRFFFAAMFSLILGQVAASLAPFEPPKIVWGVRNVQAHLLVHTNGKLAWSGVRQKGVYDPAHAFYHAAGSVAWDGMKRSRNSWGDASNDGIFYYANGKIAWGGILQKLNSWGEPHKEGIFYHANGRVAWKGVIQSLNSWGEPLGDASFYHTNGAKVWEGLPLSKDRKESFLYHENGQVAWDKNGVYDPSGLLITHYADYVSLSLGDGSWLYVDREGMFTLSLNLGEGYYLEAFPNGVHLKVMNQIIHLN